MHVCATLFLGGCRVWWCFFFFFVFFFSWGTFLIKCQIQLGTGNTLYDSYLRKSCQLVSSPVKLPSALQRLVWAMGSSFGRVLFCIWLKNIQYKGHENKTTHIFLWVSELQFPKHLRIFWEFSMPLDYKKCKIVLRIRAKAQRAYPFTSATLPTNF